MKVVTSTSASKSPRPAAFAGDRIRLTLTDKAAIDVDLVIV
jgi:hypothetical protein